MVQKRIPKWCRAFANEIGLLNWHLNKDLRLPVRLMLLLNTSTAAWNQGKFAVSSQLYRFINQTKYYTINVYFGNWLPFRQATGSSAYLLLKQLILNFQSFEIQGKGTTETGYYIQTNYRNAIPLLPWFLW